MGEARRKRAQAGEERAFHFTTFTRLPWIINDLAINPSRHIRAHEDGPPGRGVVWFTTDGRRADRTSSADREQHDFWLRFSVPLDKTMPWRDACEAAGWSAADIALAAERGRKAGADPDVWRATTEPYRLGSRPGPARLPLLQTSEQLRIEIFSGNIWRPFAPEVTLSEDLTRGTVGQGDIHFEICRLPKDALGRQLYAVRRMP